MWRIFHIWKKKKTIHNCKDGYNYEAVIDRRLLVQRDMFSFSSIPFEICAMRIGHAYSIQHQERPYWYIANIWRKLP